MSMFIGSSSQYSQASVDPEKIKLSQIQFDATAATFNKVLSTCASKCLGGEYGESDLVTGEASCIDRCVAKYVKANMVIGQHLQEQHIEPYGSMPEYRKVQQMLEKGRDA
ncbi:uncharacterized protein CANTADRAFT_44328 [Suhomyces tanzawaensis NRRL Y-17324]|uniref:Mitochondrial import inner membrane translocase subunit n=1 Tax=Suhomyces tanzawaensis NRRL Y-17324 TaxID=984487 RepID=A0A1E4SQB6_9ASCO|nr:uncharacterized protein CANTADRAFT_44328 [Suhomyces tanzawaensis NRRL Y-17324]ODV81704.1 hypothetical protein CANTADRAFT_44328 [Suhomyces tanzawaensis NRRL Y-17324]